MAKRKNGRFSVIPAWAGSVVIVGHFFDGPDGPNKFHWLRSKIKGIYNSEVGMDWNRQKQGVSPEKWPLAQKPKFLFWVVQMGKL